MTPQEVIKLVSRGLHFLEFTHGPGVPVVRHALESIHKLAKLDRDYFPCYPIASAAVAGRAKKYLDSISNAHYGVQMVERGCMESGSREETSNIGTMRVEHWLLEKIDELARLERRNRMQQIHKMLEEWIAVFGPEVMSKHAKIIAAREVIDKGEGT